jgi:surfactin synthase thioesterase subunit
VVSRIDSSRGVGSIRAVNDRSSPTLILPGPGGDNVNPAFFCSSVEHAARFQTIGHPGWPRYVETGFSADKLIEHLAVQIAVRAPEGPIHIIGISLGAHLGYAAALNLQASGREVGGFCAIVGVQEVVRSRPSRRRPLANPIGQRVGLDRPTVTPRRTIIAEGSACRRDI